MRYVVNTLKAEIKNIQGYLDYCESRLQSETLPEDTRAKYTKEIKVNQRRIKEFRNAITTLIEK